MASITPISASDFSPYDNENYTLTEQLYMSPW